MMTKGMATDLERLETRLVSIADELEESGYFTELKILGADTLPKTGAGVIWLSLKGIKKAPGIYVIIKQMTARSYEFVLYISGNAVSATTCKNKDFWGRDGSLVLSDFLAEMFATY